MNERKTLVAITLGEVALLVAVLAGYLIAIAARLRSVSSKLGAVTFGVRAIERQTAPIGPRLREVNEALEGVAAALHDVVGDAPQETTTAATASAQDAGTIEAPGDVPHPET